LDQWKENEAVVYEIRQKTIKKPFGINYYCVRWCDLQIDSCIGLSELYLDIFINQGNFSYFEEISLLNNFVE